MKKELVQVNEQSAELYLDETGEKGNVIVWGDEKENTILYISGYLDKETLGNTAQR